jgi:outer membrane protein assembly factor BamB
MLYFLKGEIGFLTCLDAATGKAHYSNKRLGIKRIFASPAGVQDKVYILGRDGVMVVISSGPEFNILTKNTLDDKFDASPVIVGNEIYLRGHQYLYCISGNGK